MQTVERRIVFNEFWVHVAGLLTAVALSSVSQQVLACPAFVRDLHTQYLPKDIPSICVAVDRYQAALSKLESKGVTPAARIADLHATRMINPPTWLAMRKASNYSPWFVYQPAPSTWGMWENGAAIIDNETAQNYADGHVPAVSREFLMTVHKAALSGLSDQADQYRQQMELGRAWSRSNSLTKAQSEALVKFEHRSLENKKLSLISWHPTSCLEDRDPEFQKWYPQQSTTDLTKWPEIDPRVFYVEKGHRKQCGYILYAPFPEVQAQLDKWLNFLNTILKSWGTRHAQGDPLFTASKAARWFIGIHPYVNGNGRTSRFTMEYILKSIGLPSPILANMDYDIVSTEEEWALEIGRGIRRAILVAENCAKDPSIGGCAIVPTASLLPAPPVDSSGSVTQP